MNFLHSSCSCSSFRLFSDDHQSNLRSQSSSQDSFNSSFSSRSNLLIRPPSTTVHHHCSTTFHPNSNSQILSLTLAGNLLFSGTSTAQIHLHHRHPTTTGDNQFITIPTTSAVKSLQILNENTLITSHQDHKIRIWKIDDYQLKIITTLPTLKDRLTKILFSKNYVQIRRHKKLTWIHHNDAVSSLAVSIDGSLIYSASWDRSFKVWRTSDFKCLESISNAHDDAINAVVVSGDGFVYTGSADKKIKVWKNYNRRDLKHELVDSLEHHKSAVNALDYDEIGCVLYSGACSGVLIASERSSGGGDGGHMVVVGGLLGHKKAVLCVRVVSELVCSGSADKTVRLWRRSVVEKRYSCLGVLEGHGGPVKCLAVAAESSGDGGDDDGSEYTVYSGGLDGDIKVWKIWVPFLAMDKASMSNLDI